MMNNGRCLKYSAGEMMNSYLTNTSGKRAKHVVHNVFHGCGRAFPIHFFGGWRGCGGGGGDEENESGGDKEEGKLWRWGRKGLEIRE